LDAEFAPVVRDGLLKKSLGCGVAIGVVDRGIRREFSYGAARNDSIFEIGSITKTFTGLALAQFVVQGKLKLDAPIRSLIFPGLSAGTAGTEITLLDLATHRSGLPSVPDNLDPRDPDDPFADYDQNALLQYLTMHGTEKPADAKYQYSSFGIGILGFVLARNAGVPYVQMIRNEVTGPLQMNDTGFELPPTQERRLIAGHNVDLEPIGKQFTYGEVFSGALAAKSTVGDLLTYLDANLHPARYTAGAAPGASAATLPAAIALDHQLRAEVKPNTDVAIEWIYDRESKIFEHGGTTPGFTAHVEFAPDRDRGIVVLYNRMDGLPEQERFVDKIAENINELMAGTPAVRLDPVPADDPARDALANGANN